MKRYNIHVGKSKSKTSNVGVLTLKNYLKTKTAYFRLPSVTQNRRVLN